MPVVPFRVFGAVARPLTLPPRVVLLWNRVLVQSVSPVEVSLLLVKRSRFAVSPCLGCAVFPQRMLLVTSESSQNRSSLRASPSFRVLPNCTYLILPQQGRSSHGLLFPTAHEGSQVHLTRVCRPATFRLQGLVTLLTVSSLPSRAGFISHRQRSWDFPFGGFPSQAASGAFPPG
jgi:hypothetical protein